MYVVREVFFIWKEGTSLLFCIFENCSKGNIQQLHQRSKKEEISWISITFGHFPFNNFTKIQRKNQTKMREDKNAMIVMCTCIIVGWHNAVLLRVHISAKLIWFSRLYANQFVNSGKVRNNMDFCVLLLSSTINLCLKIT